MNIINFYNATCRGIVNVMILKNKRIIHNMEISEKQEYPQHDEIFK